MRKGVKSDTCKTCGGPTKTGLVYCTRKCLYACPEWRSKIGTTFKLGAGRAQKSCSSCGDPFQPCNSRHRLCDKCKNGASRSVVLKMIRYDISREQAESITESVCELCPEPAQHADHNHETGTYRGALCPACNQALGRFELDGWIERAKEYLEVHSVKG